MSDVIRWEEPPAHGRVGQVRSKYAAMADALRSHPKDWALVLDDAPMGKYNGLASRMRAGASVFAPRGAFEARQVGAAGADKAKVYARYVGGAS